MHKIKFNGKEFENVQTALNEVVFEHYPIKLKKYIKTNEIEIENDNEKKICKSYSEAEEFILKNDSNSK